MENATNKDAVDKFTQVFGGLSNKGYPWSSPKMDASKRIVLGTNSIKGTDAELNKVYILRRGMTIAERVDHPYGNYFQADSLVMVTEKRDDGQAEVFIVGQTFYVTSNSGFANQSATWIDPKMSKKGFATVSQLFLTEIEEALKVIGA